MVVSGAVYRRTTHTEDGSVPRRRITMHIAYAALVGGALIGGAATLLLACNGRIPGISGIVPGAFAGLPDERSWRSLFLLGLVGAATVALH